MAGGSKSNVKRATIEAAVDRMTKGIVAVEHEKSEPALTELGRLLGAEASKPDGQGRSDSVWCWDGRVWIAVEAKSEQDPEREIALRDVRQANTQLAQLAEDRGAGIPILAAVIILHRGRAWLTRPSSQHRRTCTWPIQRSSCSR